MPNCLRCGKTIMTGETCSACDTELALKDLLNAAEEMFECCGPNLANAEQWKAAIDAARKELEA